MIAAVVAILAITWVSYKLGVEPAFLLVPAGAVWLVLKAKKRVSTSRIAGARVVTHRFGPGAPLDTITHELGHKRLIEKQGGRVTRFVVNKNGSGYVRGYLPKRIGVVGKVAVSAAGGLAEGSWRGAGGDLENIEEHLSELPKRERAAARRAGFALSRSKLFWNPVTAEAKKIYRKGWGGS